MTSEQATTEDALKAGRAALSQHEWEKAFELLSTADSQTSLGAEDLERLGEAAMWAYQPDECIAAYERAFAAHAEAGNRQQAAHVGLRLLAELNATQGSESVAAGWISRLARLLRDEPEYAEHGYLSYVYSQVHLARGDADQAFGAAQRAFDLGGKFEDRTLRRWGCTLRA